MTGMEIFLAMAGAVGLAEVIKLIVEKKFSKKRDKIAEKKDEFSALRERLDYNEKVQNGLMRKQAENSRKIAMMYSFIAEIMTQTCSKTGCKMRKLIEADLSIFDDDWEQVEEEKPQEGQEVEA